LKGKDVRTLVSFPGMYKDEWDMIVKNATQAESGVRGAVADVYDHAQEPTLLDTVMPVRGADGAHRYVHPHVYRAARHAGDDAAQHSKHLSAATVFLPKGDERFGRHSDNSDTGKCWCHNIYDGPKEWGCCWFEEWRSNVKTAVDLGHTLVVKYKREQVGQGKVAWESLPSLQHSADRPGLGGSQVGEVAYLDKMGFEYEEEEV